MSRHADAPGRGVVRLLDEADGDSVRVVDQLGRPAKRIGWKPATKLEWLV